jgi:tRNA(fMet)-specific endonuclease VapC
MLRYLLDTNIVSEPLRLQPDERILRQLQTHREECAIASLVWHELWFGCLQLPPSARRSKIEHYLAQVVQPSLVVLPYDAQAAAWHARERARLKASGRIPPFVDGQIAAVAATQNLRLVTLNEADYMHFSGLVLENWHSA